MAGAVGGGGGAGGGGQWAGVVKAVANMGASIADAVGEGKKSDAKKEEARMGVMKASIQTNKPPSEESTDTKETKGKDAPEEEKDQGKTESTARTTAVKENENGKGSSDLLAGITKGLSSALGGGGMMGGGGEGGGGMDVSKIAGMVGGKGGGK